MVRELFRFDSINNYIIYKYWVWIDVINKKKKLVLDHNWYEFEPQQPSHELLEIMRSF